jgi:hypothetical protein
MAQKQLYSKLQTRPLIRQGDHPVPGGCKYGDLALQVGGVSNGIVKYGSEFWQGPEAIVQVNYRPVLSSERVFHIKKPAFVRQKT